MTSDELRGEERCSEELRSEELRGDELCGDELCGDELCGDRALCPPIGAFGHRETPHRGTPHRGAPHSVCMRASLTVCRQRFDSDAMNCWNCPGACGTGSSPVAR